MEDNLKIQKFVKRVSLFYSISIWCLVFFIGFVYFFGDNFVGFHLPFFQIMSLVLIGFLSVVYYCFMKHVAGESLLLKQKGMED